MRPHVAGALVLGSLLLAAAGLASNLKDVRVGPHGEYTRVVLETDAKASYSLNQTDEVVTIELQASATPKAVTAKSQQLSWVRVEPAGESSVVRIELKGPARVKQMVLSGPNRIVLDVYAEPAAATRPAPEPAVDQPTPVVVPPPVAAVSPGPDAQLHDESELLHQEADALLGPAPAEIPGDELAATEGVPGEIAPGAEEAGGQEAEVPAVAPKPPIKTVAAPPDKGFVEWLMDPYILGGLAVVMLALFVILRRRQPAAKTAATAVEAEEESAASLFGSSEQAQAPALSDATEVFERGDASPEAAEGEERPAAREGVEESGSPFEFEAPDAEPEKPDVAPPRGPAFSTISAVTSTAAYETHAPAATGGLTMAELERRLALLEQRLEEVIDAKDRLERQVSAQTEELRVQRAAIARTQRVLRTVVRPEEDQASEPVLKS
jgi:hypothetical protein